MGFHLKRNLIIFATLLLMLQISKGQDDPPTESEEEDDSSSEETVEDSNESRKRRRRRSLEVSGEPAVSTSNNENSGKSSRAIPGLPDAATLEKIGEILTSVGEQVIPLLISGKSGATGFVQNRISRDMKFLQNFKNEVDYIAETLKKKK